jgi:hypothetical protein
VRPNHPSYHPPSHPFISVSRHLAAGSKLPANSCWLAASVRKSPYGGCTVPTSHGLSPAFSAIPALLLPCSPANTVQAFSHLPSFQSLAHSVQKKGGEGGPDLIMVNHRAVPIWNPTPDGPQPTFLAVDCGLSAISSLVSPLATGHSPLLRPVTNRESRLTHFLRALSPVKLQTPFPVNPLEKQ